MKVNITLLTTITSIGRRRRPAGLLEADSTESFDMRENVC